LKLRGKLILSSTGLKTNLLVFITNSGKWLLPAIKSGRVLDSCSMCELRLSNAGVIPVGRRVHGYGNDYSGCTGPAVGKGKLRKVPTTRRSRFKEIISRPQKWFDSLYLTR
jgi:hypothetical protein